MSKSRRGRLSLADQRFIRANAAKLTPEKIAQTINKTEEMVRKWIVENVNVAPVGEVVPEKTLVKAQIKTDLRNRIEWKYLRAAFMDDELEFFEHRYMELMRQFKDDVAPTEDTQIFFLIKFELLMERNLKDRKRAVSDIERLQKELDELYTAHGDYINMDQITQNTVSNMENMLAQAKEANKSKTDEITKLMNEHKVLMRELNATRQQRIKELEEEPQNFLSLIKALQHEEFRQAEARQYELVKRAVEKETEKLSNSHQFADGSYDSPILSSETV